MLLVSVPASGVPDPVLTRTTTGHFAFALTVCDAVIVTRIVVAAAAAGVAATSPRSTITASLLRCTPRAYAVRGRAAADPRAPPRTGHRARRRAAARPPS